MSISKQMAKEESAAIRSAEDMDKGELIKLADKYKNKMQDAAADLNFEIAAEYRDRLIEIKNMLRDLEVKK